MHQALHVFEDRGVVETVYNPLIQAELQVHILPLDHGTVGQDLIGPPFAAEGAENRQIAEIIQMVINGGNPQRAHGGEKYGAVEGTDLQKELGQHAEVIQGPQEPHREFQEHPGD